MESSAKCYMLYNTFTTLYYIFSICFLLTQDSPVSYRNDSIIYPIIFFPSTRQPQFLFLLRWIFSLFSPFNMTSLSLWLRRHYNLIVCLRWRQMGSPGNEAKFQWNSWMSNSRAYLSLALGNSLVGFLEFKCRHILLRKQSSYICKFAKWHS